MLAHRLESVGVWVADRDITLCQAVFYTVVAQVDAIVEPDGIGNDVRWESVAFVYVHLPILAILGSKLGDTKL